MGLSRVQVPRMPFGTNAANKELILCGLVDLLL